MFKTEVKKGQVLGPEFMPHYWNPNRIGARKAPAWFMEKVDRDFADIEIVWNPINQRWQVFSKAPKMQHPLVSGWRLLFVHNGANGEHLPLDERLLARLESIDMHKQGGVGKYFDRILQEMQREKEAKKKQYDQDTMDLMIERGWDHSRIQVSMRGKSNGSKFSDYHA